MRRVSLTKGDNNNSFTDMYSSSHDLGIAGNYFEFAREVEPMAFHAPVQCSRASGSEL